MRIVGEKPEDALGDDEVVIRRVVPSNRRDDGKREISKSQFSASSAARDPEEGMSVDLMSNLLARGIDATNKATFAPDSEVLMTLKVGELHDLALWVVPRPYKDGSNPAHCNVLNVTKNKRKAILGMATFLRRPDDVVKSTD
jgi:hypothetical protein